MKQYFFDLLVVILVIFSFRFFATAEVNGTSMYPTYDDGDFLVLRKTKSVERGTKVAIKNNDMKKILCKRVIGLEGDHILIDETGTYINGVLEDESYVNIDTNCEKYVDIVVGKNQLFVMGDNRGGSTDSRDFGCLSVNDLVGTEVINITKVFGLNRKDLIIFIIVCFTFLLCIDNKSNKCDDIEIKVLF